ncbi:hypothetical protein [Rhodococcoides yunnanense]|uniref:hypothetical protein n=1 Tax=Rhodococcoides yunnanense TaxID=278209 RepID=UPI0009354D01|nr:hypothetical protein [Rhodococcus yunnanensis]
MTTRRITIDIDFPSTEPNIDDRYSDAASAIWMLLKAMSEPGRFDFSVDHDGVRPNLGKEMNDRWDSYGKKARWH